MWMVGEEGWAAKGGGSEELKSKFCACLNSLVNVSCGVVGFTRACSTDGAGLVFAARLGW